MMPKIVGDFYPNIVLNWECKSEEEVGSAEEQPTSNKVYQLE
ncbi:hypothetical protein [Marivirga sp.]|nr:hypothetical protein [Marivirga sp.]HET8859302.1 hypothetical protein [Marivirga sp.]HET8860149.1 hypothetical protein [Marivirga sp.]HET8860760.1 hypothetical protein [Marivirga sp.]